MSDIKNSCGSGSEIISTAGNCLLGVGAIILGDACFIFIIVSVIVDLAA